MRKTVDQLIGEMGLNEETIAKRKAFLQFTQEDEKILATLHDAMGIWYAGDFPNAFYEHLLAFEETRQFLTDPQVVARLKEKQRAYFLEMMAGPYDMAYVVKRVTVALVHANIGIKADWYLAAFNIYFLLLWPKLRELYQDDLEKLSQAGMALQKIILFDLILSVDTYSKISERTIHDLQTMKSFVEGVLAELPAGVIVLDQKSTIVFANDKARKLLNTSLEPGTCIQDSIAMPALQESIATVRASGRPKTGIFYATPSKKLMLAIAAKPESEGVLMAIEDVTHYLDAKKTEAMLYRIIEETPDLILNISPEGKVLYLNNAARQWFGEHLTDSCMLTEFQPEEEAQKVKTQILPIVHEKGSWSGESIFLDRSGHTIPMIETFIAHRDQAGEVGFYSVLLKNIAEIKTLQQSVDYLKNYDPLTGLPNRTLFQAHLHDAIRQAKTNGKLVAIILFDIEYFRRFNDVFGYSTGDQALKHIAGILQRTLRNIDRIARMGGDEFGIILTGISRVDAVLRVLQKILHAIQQPLHLSGEEHTLRIKAGISVYPYDGQEAEILVRRAEAALNTAKKTEGLTFIFFSPAMDEEARTKIALEKELLNALDRKEFELFYQPQIEIATGRIASFEALIRWRHPQKGLVSPSHFVPVLEETTLIREVGNWVIEEACRQAAQWQKNGLPFDYIAINASAHQLADDALEEKVVAALANCSLDAPALSIEVTESALIAELPRTIASLDRLRGLGIGIAIDDFGTGYSSLAQLYNLPINCVKIDRSFIKGLPNDRHGRSIVRAVLSICEELGLDAVAEGVETIEQKDYLLSKQCPKFQGYLFSPPQPPDQIEKLVKAF